MTDFQQGMVVGALIALYLAWLLLDHVPVLRMYLFRRSVMREAERRLAAAEATLSGWVSQREFRRGSNPPPNSVKPPPPHPPPMRVIREGGCPPRAPEDVQ